MTISDVILNVLEFIMVLIFLYFTYMIINVYYTIFKQKRKDHTLKFCFNSTGRICYFLFSAIYIISIILCIIFIVRSIPKDDLSTLRTCINILGLMAVLYSFFISNLILIGHKEMMIGRMLIDYRKMKKISYGLDGKVTFIYAQKEFNFHTRFTDLKKIRAAIKR